MERMSANQPSRGSSPKKTTRQNSNDSKPTPPKERRSFFRDAPSDSTDSIASQPIAAQSAIQTTGTVQTTPRSSSVLIDKFVDRNQPDQASEEMRFDFSRIKLPERRSWLKPEPGNQIESLQCNAAPSEPVHDFDIYSPDTDSRIIQFDSVAERRMWAEFIHAKAANEGELATADTKKAFLRIRDKVFEFYMRFADESATTFFRRMPTYALVKKPDCVAAAYVGLLDAVLAFDPHTV
jgi:hypothetical protein